MKKYFLLLLASLFIITACNSTTEKPKEEEKDEELTIIELAELTLENLEETDSFTFEYLQFEGYIIENGLSPTGTLIDSEVAWYTHRYNVYGEKNAEYSFIEDYTDSTHAKMQNRCNYDDGEFAFLINDVVQDTDFSVKDCDKFFERGDFDNTDGVDLLENTIKNLGNEDSYTVTDEGEYLKAEIHDIEGYSISFNKDGKEVFFMVEGYTTTIIKVH